MSGDRVPSSAARSRIATVVDTFAALPPIARFYGAGGIVLLLGIVSGYATDSSRGIAVGIVAGTVGITAYLGLGILGPAKR
jgi:hypothetical protein